jgi:hypothetical protein
MPGPEDYLKRAEAEEAQAAALPQGFEREERLRRAAAWRDLAETLQAQETRQSGRG